VWQRRAHNNHGVSEEFHIGDRVWLHTPVVPRGHTKKFASLRRGPYTILDKPGSVKYKIQSIVGTQCCVVHCTRLKLCLTPPLTVSPQPRLEFQDPTTSYADATADSHLRA